MTNYVLKSKFEKDNTHLASVSNNSTITFNRTTPTLDISIPTGTYNAGSSFNILVYPKNPDGTDIYVPSMPIQLYINNVLVKSDTTQQEGYSGTLTVPAGATGSITIKVVLMGDSVGYYNTATKTISLALGTPTSTAVDTTMTLSAPSTAEVGSNVKLTATLKTKSGTPLSNKQVTFKRGANDVIDVVYTNSNGVATKTVPVTISGTNSFNAIFNGEINNYNSSSANAVVVGLVTSIQPILTMVSSTNIYQGWKLKLLYANNNGQPIADKIVNITVNGVTYQKTTNSDGIAELTIKLMENTYSFSANVAANGKYLSASMTGSFKVISPITVEKKPGCVSWDAASAPRKAWDASHIYSDADVYKEPADGYYLSTGSIGSKVGTWHAIQPLNQACFGFNIPNGSIIQKIEAVWLHKYSRNNSNINMGTGTVYLTATGQDTIILQGSNNPGNNTWTQNNASTTDVSGVNANALNQNAFQAKIIYEANSNYNTGELHIGWFSIKVTYVPPQG